MTNDMTREVKWTAGNGKEIIVTVSLTTTRYVGKNEWTDEDITKPICQISTNATMGGADVGGLGYVSIVKDGPTVNGVKIMARIGGLGMNQENYDRVRAAEAEIEASDYVQAWRVKEAKADAEADEYYAHVERVNRMMGE